MTHYLKFIAAGIAAVSLMAWPNIGRSAEKHPVELGKVRWHRSLPEAIPLAKKHNKPIFVLFQEVPGCLTCQNYGHKVLSHPLIVEAIETHFIPVVVFNNRGGQDAATLKKFQEPSWNNPVVRILNANEKDLVPRLSGDYSRSGLVQRMIVALQSSDSPVPPYLRLLGEELAAKSSQTEKGVFAMYCFWSGEGMFGQLDGVVSTQPGFLNGHEVVEVEYDPEKLPFDKLVQKAKQHDMAGRVYTRSEKQRRIAEKRVGKNASVSNKQIRIDREPKYYLSRTPLRFVPMTELQAARVNSAVGSRKDFSDYLSPRQLNLLSVIQQNPKAGWQNVIGTKNLIDSWQSAVSKAQKLLKEQNV